MFQKVFFIGFVFLTMWSCSSDASKVKSEPAKADTVSNVEAASEDHKQYMILSQQAGEFKIGDSFSSPKVNSYTLLSGIISRSTEEGTEEIPAMYMIEKSDTLVTMMASYNYTTSSFEDKIGEILIYSSDFVTAQNIRKGSTLKELQNAYSKLRFYYSYVGGFFWAETEELKNVQFVLSTDDFTSTRQDLSNSDMVELQASDFNEQATVEYFRIY